MRAVQLSRVPFASAVVAKRPRQMATSRGGNILCISRAMPAETIHLFRDLVKKLRAAKQNLVFESHGATCQEHESSKAELSIRKPICPFFVKKVYFYIRTR